MSAHLARVTIDGDEWLVPWRTGPDGDVEPYTVAILGDSGGEALLAIIRAGRPFEDHEALLAALEAACPEDACLGHQVRRLQPEQMAQLAVQIRASRARWN